MFEKDKIYRFVDGRSVVISRTSFGWKFLFRDVQKFLIWELELKNTSEILNRLIKLVKDDLEEALNNMKRFYPTLEMPSDDVIRAGVIAGLKDYNLMEDMDDE
jgi:hypothetical protein